MKRIAFFLPSLNIGGIENVFITYANELAMRGHKVSFILCNRVGALLPLVSSDVRIDSLNVRRLRFSFAHLRRFIKHNKYDVLITGGDFPNIVCVIATLLYKGKPKLILSKHNYQSIETNSLGWWARYDMILQKILYPKANSIIAVSKGIERYLIETLKIDPKSVAQICNPINVNQIEKAGAANLPMQLPERYLAFVGRLGKVKNLPLLLKAFNLIDDKNLYLVIVGDGSEKESLVNFSQSLACKDRIRFVGSLENPMPIIKNAMALVLCSFSEAYPTILLETMIFGTPIVSTPTEGAKEILNGIYGAYITTSFDDENELKEQICNAITNRSRGMKDAANKNDKKIIVDEMEKLINKM